MPRSNHSPETPVPVPIRMENDFRLDVDELASLKAERDGLKGTVAIDSRGLALIAGRRHQMGGPLGTREASVRERIL